MPTGLSSQGRKLLSAVVLAGFVTVAVAAPKVSVHADANLESYQKVYVQPIKNDHAKVYPGLVKRLQKLGFDVAEFKRENLPYTSQGSGFVLTPDGFVMTCAHVVGDQPKATLWIQGARHLGRVIATDTNVDAALIQVEGEHPSFNPVAFSQEDVYHLGQDVFTMGFPLADLLGSNPRLSKGLISSTVGFEDNPQRLQISAEIQAGNSGSPLLTSHGEVIGMVSSTLNPWRTALSSGGDLPQNVNFAIKKKPLQDFLTAAKISLSQTTNTPAKDTFDEVAKSLVLIRGGIVEEQRLHEKPLICICNYVIWNGDFARMRIQFFDLRKVRVVLTANLDKSTIASENSVLDHMFEQIGAKLSPNSSPPSAGRTGK